MTIPPCPRCGTNKHATARRDGLYHCSLHGLYDDDPDEGGTHHNWDPSRRLTREEDWKRKRRSQRR